VRKATGGRFHLPFPARDGQLNGNRGRRNIFLRFFERKIADAHKYRAGGRLFFLRAHGAPGVRKTK